MSRFESFSRLEEEKRPTPKTTSVLERKGELSNEEVMFALKSGGVRLNREAREKLSSEKLSFHPDDVRFEASIFKREDIGGSFAEAEKTAKEHRLGSLARGSAVELAIDVAQRPGVLDDDQRMYVIGGSPIEGYDAMVWKEQLEGPRQSVVFGLEPHVEDRRYEQGSLIACFEKGSRVEKL